MWIMTPVGFFSIVQKPGDGLQRQVFQRGVDQIGRLGQYLGPGRGLRRLAVGKPQVAQQVQHDGSAVLARLRERQAGHGAHLQLELRHIAGVLAVVAAVVRARGDLVDHQAAVLQHEKLDAQHTHVVQAICY